MNDDWIENALRADASEHAAAHIDDNGFTARVMAGLPEAVQLPRWRRPVVAAMWLLAAAGTLVALPELAIDIGREAFRLLAGQPVSLPQIAVAFALIGFATYGGAAYAWKTD